MAVKDISFRISETSDTTEILNNTDAVSMAIRNILLSQEGVFVNIPDLNTDVSNLLFDQISDDDIYTIKNTISRELTKRIPSLAGISMDVKKITVQNSLIDGQTALGISILKEDTGENHDLLLFKEEGKVVIL